MNEPIPSSDVVAADPPQAAPPAAPDTSACPRVTWFSPGRLFLALLLAAAFVAAWKFWVRSRERYLAATRTALHTAFKYEEYDETIKLARELLEYDPDQVDVALQGAGAALKLHKLDTALEFLQLATRRPHDRLARVYAQIGFIYAQQHDLDRAEANWLKSVEVDPTFSQSLQQLCYIYSLESRRWESLPFHFQLVRKGDFVFDDLFFLGNERVAVAQIDQLNRLIEQNPDYKMAHFGLGRVALSTSDIETAIKEFKTVIEAYPDYAGAYAWLGHAYLRLPAGEREEHLQQWHRSLPERAEAHPEIWVVRGRWAQQRRDWSGAIRCFWEALKRNPNEAMASYQIAICLFAVGASEQAVPFQERAKRLQDLERLSSELRRQGVKPPGLAKGARLCEQLGRYWEAAAWCRFLVDPNLGARMRQMYAEHEASREAFYKSVAECREILSRIKPHLGNDLPRIHPDFDLARKIDLSNYPLPEFPPLPPENQPASGADLARQPAFRETTRELGIDFTYFNSDDPKIEGRRMFEFTGGGVTVIDYDQDGWPDLYFTQGCIWPVDPKNRQYRDRLYRNIEGRRFVDVTDQTGLGDQGFTQGAAAGDYNNDGWPDLLVGNVGANRLYLNNGDGTFTETTGPARLTGDVWTTSCAIADLNGDSVPDLYCVNYLQKGRAFTLVCGREGRLRACSPTEFDAEQDQLFVGRGDGSFDDRTTESGIVRPDGKGLGCLVADVDRRGGLELFVANDTTANFLFVNRRPAGEMPSYEERAMIVGLGVDHHGAAQACMGIGFDDIDGDGRFDLFVTNFFREPNALYRQQESDPLLFLDECGPWGITRSSLQLLGFGTQFIDAELDGLPDLIVTNGHVDDFTHVGQPHQMPPQYLRNIGGRFLDWPASELGPFFERRHLGRGLARLDYNGDGREDFAVSHLETPAAVVENQSRNPGHYLVVRLAATKGARDGIGTDVTVEAGGLHRVRQLTAGDGYLATNERILVFGLGPHRVVDRISVRWPNGRRETFEHLAADQEVKIVEGHGVYRLDRKPAPLVGAAPAPNTPP